MEITDDHIAIGADFSRIFDSNDFLAMLNIPDEAMCVLRAHLILEEFLNLWSSKVTNTEDLYNGTFIPFKTKLVISRNLGMSDDIFMVADRINDVRNRFSHRKGHILEKSTIDALRTKVDDLETNVPMLKCNDFKLFISGKDQYGNPAELTHTWGEADNRIRFLIVFLSFMLKFTHWITGEFVMRGIAYEIEAITVSVSD
ncbi:hypothetical protein [Pseudomonas syringae]|uniref:hypothetical protein n=1 Tax=Pseudomonas syringae TaxID=317 RepID=UPI001BCCF823|nr:hypothetical protein [Pseudomonas syringae]QVK30979.1 hypothetical protein KIJ28_18010 [Pseudomonas syringae]